jgi:hypothetical protein
LHTAGWLLMPLGGALILIGWWGVAHTTRTWEQTPYLVSGSLFGLGLIFMGGFAYFAHWLTQSMELQREHRRDALEEARATLAALDRIEALMRGGAPLAGGEKVMTTGFVTTASGTLVHRPDCSMVAGKMGLKPARLDDPGLRPCQVCQPA